MKYAIIKLGTKQFTIQEGDVIELETQTEPLKIDVLFFSDEGKVSVGTPILENVVVKASVIEEKRGDKVRVNRFKAKSRYHKFGGHRQPLSVVKIEEIVIGDAKTTKTKSETKTEVAETKEAPVKAVKISKPREVAKKAPAKAKAKTTKKAEAKK